MPAMGSASDSSFAAASSLREAMVSPTIGVEPATWDSSASAVVRCELTWRTPAVT